MAQPRVEVQYIQFYTYGSAAKKVAPATSYNTQSLPHTQKPKVKKVYVDPVAALGATVAVCMLIMMLVGLYTLQTQQEKTLAAVEQVQALYEENQSLQAQFKEECNMEQVEETALALGMIPREEAEHISISVEVPPVQEAETATMWQRIGTFLTNLFA